jgi:hypothetical protein
MTTTEYLNLARIETGYLVDRIVDPASTAPFGVYAIAATAPESELGRYVERLVFGEVFDNSAEVLATEYDPFDAASVFFCVIDHRRRVPAGAVRVILPSAAGLKTYVDIEAVWGQSLGTVLRGTTLPGDAHKTWDVATLAVASDYRGGAFDGLIGTALYQALGATAARAGIDWFVATMDSVVLELFQRKLHDAWKYFPGVGPRPYLGSKLSVPVWGSFREWREEMKTVDPPLLDLIERGEGLEAAVSHVDWDESAALVRSVIDSGYADTRNRVAGPERSIAVMASAERACA